MHKRAENRGTPLLFVGDIHLGRRPESIAQVVESAGVSVRELSPRAAWENVVQYAIDHAVKAVVLAGDVIDREEHYIESYQVVERAAHRLQKAGIPLIAVAGNHDATLLPRLDDAVEGVTLLGRGGRWERHVLQGEGVDVELIGWSFPSSHVQENPLDAPEFTELLNAPRQAAHRILVAHGDLDAKSSNYAPMQRAQLEHADIDAAFLGHIHAPDPLDQDRPIGYLGSLTGLDSAETGQHGPVEVRIGAAGHVVAERIDNAPIRWEHISVDVSHDQPWTAETLLQHVRDEIRAWMTAHPLHPSTRVLAVRLTLEGRRPLAEWTRSFDALHHVDARALDIPDATALVVLERTLDATGLRIDLAAESREQTPIGRVARMILDGPSEAQLREAEEHIRGAYRREEVDGFEEIDVKQELQSAAQRMLEQMIAAREHGGTP